MKLLPKYPCKDLLIQVGLVTHYTYHFHCLHFVEAITKDPKIGILRRKEEIYIYLNKFKRRELVGRAELHHAVIQGARLLPLCCPAIS